MVSVIACAVMIYGTTRRIRVLGCTLTIFALAGIFFSGSRGGIVSVLVATAYFVGIWLVRTLRFQRYSMAPAVVGAIGATGFTTVLLLIIFWTRAHNMVLGGADDAASDLGARCNGPWEYPRLKQTRLPVTGSVWGRIYSDTTLRERPIRLSTVPSCPCLSRLAFPGQPSSSASGFSQFGADRRYWTDPSFYGALDGGLSAAIVAFLVYKSVLSQRENYGFFFVLVGCSLILGRFSTTRRRANADAELDRPPSQPKKMPRARRPAQAVPMRGPDELF